MPIFHQTDEEKNIQDNFSEKLTIIPNTLWINPYSIVKSSIFTLILFVANTFGNYYRHPEFASGLNGFVNGRKNYSLSAQNFNFGNVEEKKNLSKNFLH